MSLYDYEVLVHRRGATSLLIDAKVTLKGMDALLETMTTVDADTRSLLVQELITEGSFLFDDVGQIYIFEAQRIPERYR